MDKLKEAGVSAETHVLGIGDVIILAQSKSNPAQRIPIKFPLLRYLDL